MNFDIISFRQLIHRHVYDRLLKANCNKRTFFPSFQYFNWSQNNHPLNSASLDIFVDIAQNTGNIIIMNVRLNVDTEIFKLNKL